MRRFPVMVAVHHSTRWIATRSLFCALLLSPLAAGFAGAQFEDQPTGIPGLEQGSAEWGDYDNDGDLDIVVTGRDGSLAVLSRIYRNDGGSFVDIDAGLAGVERSSASWSDYDGDGDLDLLLAGLDATAGALTRLYRNDLGIFVDANAGFPALSESSTAWADFDGDGALDIALCGLDGSGQPLTRLYRNAGGTFVPAITALANVSHGSLAWGDYDTDGDPDLLLTGALYGGTAFTTLYRNDVGTLVDSQIALTQVRNSAVAWTDIDSDGHLDFALTGGANGVAQLSWFTNEGSGNFIRHDFLPTALSAGRLAWGDYDSDGDPDLIVSGSDNDNQPGTRLYFNGAGLGTPANTTLENLAGGALSCGDYDGDGRLDLLLTGTTGSTPRTHLYRAHPGGNANTPPTTPNPINLTLNGNTVTFGWNAAGDNQTPTPGLTYNLRVGSTIDGHELVPAMAGNGGYRLVVRRGNAGQRTSWSLPVAGLPPTTYWSVQAVDASLAGSPFSTPQAFTFARSTTTVMSSPNPSDINGDVTVTATVVPATATGEVSFYDGTYFIATAPLAGGAATYHTTALVSGEHPLTAVYAGDGLTLGSSSPRILHTVRYLSTTTLASNPNPSMEGQSVLLTATVSPPTASGMVTFTTEDSVIGSAVLSAGQASFATPGLPALNHALRATYAGDVRYLGSISPSLDHFVNIPTTTNLTSNLNPANVGDLVTLTATVSPMPADGGIVRFMDAGQTIGSTALTSGVATVSLLAPRGTHLLTATYLGDPPYAGSSSAAHFQVVVQPTMTTLTSSSNPSVIGQAVTLTSMVSPSAATGLVTFADNGIPIGIGALNGGVAALSISLITTGNHSLSAVYDGQNNFLGSASSSLNQAVLPPSSDIVLTSSHNPSTWGQSLTFSATVYPSAVTGTVVFTEDNAPMGTRPLNGGVATFTTSTLAPGSHSIAAQYTGNGQFTGSTSLALLQRVNGFRSIGAVLPEVSDGSAAWGDYDNDSDLDLVITGRLGSAGISRVYRNDAGSFVYTDRGLVGVYESSVAWGDYDNDSDLDILLVGNTGSEAIASIYRNDGGSFVDIHAGLAGVSAGSAAWGDCDNDGDLDILLSGQTSGLQAMTRVYRNNRGDFVDVTPGLPAAYHGSSDWSDYDLDGDLDILLTGATGSGFVSLVCRNDGGHFVAMNAGLPGVDHSCGVWGDYDNDGRPDILLTGQGSGGSLSRVYRNTEAGFVDMNAGLAGVSYGSSTWCDYDNDGDLDILLTGRFGSVPGSRFYRNDGGPEPPIDEVDFVEVGVGLPGVYRSSSAWGDYDNDGDLDLLLTGATLGNPQTLSQIYQSHTAAPNTRPTAPGELFAHFAGNLATFEWSPATDFQTPAPSLTYNLSVGTTPSGSELCSSMADASTGYRRVPRLGNVGPRLSWSLRVDSWPGTGHIYWSVQAIDAAFAGSPWAVGEVSAVDTKPGLPAVPALQPGSPSPFSGTTHLSFDVPRQERVRLGVYDVRGRLVKILHDSDLPPGRYEAAWDGANGQGYRVGAGIYLVRLQSGPFQQTRRVVLLP